MLADLSGYADRVTVRPRLIATRGVQHPDGIVLVLHGGASRRESMAVSPAQLSVLRMIPVAERVARAGRGRLAVHRLLNSHRGWDASHTPVHDVAWALAALRRRHPVMPPVCLVGHSLGGRAAILAAGSAEVRSVVALAPWVYPVDGDVNATGRRVLIVHGTDDRIASIERAAAAARRLERTATVGFITVTGGRHAMLRHHALFDRAAADFAAATLLGTSAQGPVQEVLQGDRWVETA